MEKSKNKKIKQKSNVFISDGFQKLLLDNLNDGVYFVDSDRKIIFWNKGAERITGFTSFEVIGTHCSDNVLVHVDENGVNFCRAGCPLKAAMLGKNTTEEKVYLHHKEGYRVPVLVRGIPIYDESGKTVGAVEIFSENMHNNEMLLRIEELQNMVLLDPLTQVGNRRYIEMQLNAKFDEMIRFGWQFGVLFLDIDHFKRINDIYGHDIGDKVLKMVAMTLSKNVRSFDIIGRWGGEEFIILIANIDYEQLFSIANKLRILVEQSSLFIENDIIQVTVSAGAVLANIDDDVDKLLKTSDQLMYQSKSNGRNQVTFMS